MTKILFIKYWFLVAWLLGSGLDTAKGEERRAKSGVVTSFPLHRAVP